MRKLGNDEILFKEKRTNLTYKREIGSTLFMEGIT